jgi:uncharacterized LabA/DUF88 family protein
MAACSQFIFTEKLMTNYVDVSSEAIDTRIAPKRKTSKEMRQDTWLVNVLRTAVEQTRDEDNWANLASIGQYINNSTSFSPINYGYKKLSNLIDEIDLFDIYVDEESKMMSIRDKRIGN